ncbi:MAG: 1,4-dihydroxy-6-naphthoate synthase [Saprospiraceae bacterium]|nr:1,4-dihydroxy-6-naphthoate synthase [Saprospiraceae bacterium]
MQISLGFSPCPNDTFIFDALLHQRIDTEGLVFEAVLEDVEALNQLAFQGKLEMTKLSFHALGHLLGTYQLLDAGSALGRGVGPLLIARKSLNKAEIIAGPIAIPGRYTTANFLLGLAYPEATNKIEMLFSDIEQAVLDGDVAAGLIIHENRFTYQEKGLIKLLDCGAYWEETTQLPIPLGGIAVRRDLPLELKHRINRVLRRSVEYAFAHPKEALPFIRAHAQEMEESVMYKHIDLYVNDFSIDLGPEGKKAVETLYHTAFEKGLLPDPASPIFLPESES